MPFWEKCHETLSLLRMPSIGSSPSKWRLTRGGGWQQLRCVSLEKLRSQACRGAQKNNRSRTPQNAAATYCDDDGRGCDLLHQTGTGSLSPPYCICSSECMYLLFSEGHYERERAPPNQPLCSVHTWFATLTGIFQQVDGW